MGLGVGCGSEDRVLESSGRYRPPADYRVIVETVVEAPFDEVWDGLVERLSASSLRILTFDKAMHFLVIDLDRSTDAARSLNRPDRFVDCGRVERSFSEDGRAMEFAYGIAEPSRHVEAYAGEDAFEVRDVSRVVDLSARATVSLKSEGPKSTRVTLNSRYGLTVETAGTTRQVPRAAAAKEGEPRELQPLRETLRFTTFTPSTFDGERVCRATGEFERTLIALSSVPVEAPAASERREQSGPGDQGRP